MTHAHGPISIVEYGLVAVAAAALVVSLVLGFLYTVRPGEKSPDHIKRRMIEEDGP